MARFEEWNAEFARQQDTHQAAVAGLGTAVVGMASTMVDMQRDMSDFHRVVLVELGTMNAHLARLVSTIGQHLAGPVGPPGRPSGLSPVCQGSPPAAPSPPWALSPEYRALRESVLGCGGSGLSGGGQVPRRPSIIVPSLAPCSAAPADGASAIDVVVRGARHGHGEGRHTVPVGTGSTSAVRAWGPSSGSDTLAESDASRLGARSGGRSTGCETLSASEGVVCGAGPAAVGVAASALGAVRYGRLTALSSGSDTMTVSEPGLTPAGRAYRPSGSDTLPLSGDSQRLPSSDDY